MCVYVLRVCVLSAHVQVHTQVRVSKVCARGLWKCQIRGVRASTRGHTEDGAGGELGWSH